MTIRSLSQANAQPVPHARRAMPRPALRRETLNAPAARKVYCPVCGDENVGACRCVRTLTPEQIAANYAAMFEQPNNARLRK